MFVICSNSSKPCAEKTYPLAGREVLMEQLRAAAAGGKAPSTNLVEARGGEP